MYFGSTEHVMDAKGRLFLPKKLQDAYGKAYVLARSFDKFLVLYPAEVWNVLLENMAGISDTDDGADRLMRYLLGQAVEVTADDQGRILLPRNLRDKAKINRDVTLVGCGDKAEVWAKDIYDSHEADDLQAQRMAEIAHRLVPHGLTRRPTTAAPLAETSTD